MKSPKMSSIAGVSLILIGGALADSLPSLSERPWLGSWIGREERNFDFGITSKAFHGGIYMKQRGKDGYERISEFRAIKLLYLVEEEVGGKWQRRSFEPDGFETTQAASSEVEEFEVIASYKGGTKMKVRHELDGKEIAVSVSIVETESKNPLRAAVSVVIPDLYKLKEELEERELKKKLRGDEVRVRTLAGKKVKFELYEEVNLGSEKDLENGVLDFSLESKNLADKVVSITSRVEKTGKIFFTQKGSLDQGFYATWYPDQVAEGKPVPQLVVEVK